MKKFNRFYNIWLALMLTGIGILFIVLVLSLTKTISGAGVLLGIFIASVFGLVASLSLNYYHKKTKEAFKKQVNDILNKGV